jgi:hypothetical protein
MLRLRGPTTTSFVLATVKVRQLNHFLFATALCNCYGDVRAAYTAAWLGFLVLTGRPQLVVGEGAIFKTPAEFGRANQTVIVLFA